MSRIIKYEVVVCGVPVEVKNLKEAESKLKRHEVSDSITDVTYIVRKEYSRRGNLMEEIMVG